MISRSNYFRSLVGSICASRNLTFRYYGTTWPQGRVRLLLLPKWISPKKHEFTARSLIRYARYLPTDPDHNVGVLRDSTLEETYMCQPLDINLRNSAI